MVHCRKFLGFLNAFLINAYEPSLASHIYITEIQFDFVNSIEINISREVYVRLTKRHYPNGGRNW